MNSMRLFSAASLLLGALALSACGEVPQTATGVKTDRAAYEGVGASPFVAPGWKAGDQAGWQQALKARAQYSQNDYNRMSN